MSVHSILADGLFEITGAYGRDYKSQALAMADWVANKDFIVRATGQTISKSCVEQFGLKGKTLFIRYNRGRQLAPFTV